mmetsp:Transcript_1329/g.2426  ORF Transcript_1329/g.2426 Transcript_1329/m.2426 type:complete len:228 (+) Transcript_1329:4-687(+)
MRRVCSTLLDVSVDYWRELLFEWLKMWRGLLMNRVLYQTNGYTPRFMKISGMNRSSGLKFGGELSLLQNRYRCLSSSSKVKSETISESQDKYVKAMKHGEYLKSLAKTYGMPFIVYWTATWVLSGLGVYFAIEYAGKEYIVGLLKTVGLDKWINTEEKQNDAVESLSGDETLPDVVENSEDNEVKNKSSSAKWVNIGLAIAVNEALEVVRFPFCVASMPYVLKIFTK